MGKKISFKELRTMILLKGKFASPILKKPKFIDSFQIKLLNIKINKFKPKIKFAIDVRDFVVKTAETPEELRKVLRLRYDVFSKEFNVKLKFQDLDFDRYDLTGDHLLVVRKSTQEVLATYRIQCTEFTNSFYSENEFHLQKFLALPGIKIELGRACVHESFRTGMLISLVWRGLANYATLSKADYMFGCTSINTTDPKESMAVYRSLEREGVMSDEFAISPTDSYRYDNYPELVPTDMIDAAPEMIPSLFRSYLKAGAKVHGFPAFDREFNCIDFFTTLEVKNLNQQYVKRFFNP
jgi:putative hemolysin